MSRGRTVGRHARIAVRSRLIKRLPQLRCYRRTNVQPSLDSRPQGNIASRWLPHRHRIFLMHSRNQVNGSRYWRTERRLRVRKLGPWR